MAKVAEEWLNICGGCEVSILDIGEPLLGLLPQLEFVHIPVLADHKYFGAMGDGTTLEIPPADVGIVSGGVRNEKEKHVAEAMRKSCKTLIALGSCACFGGVPGLANLQQGDELLQRVYSQRGTVPAEMPTLDRLLPKQQAIVDYVKVDFKIPGCPPEMNDIATILTTLLNGGTPELCKTDVCEQCPRERIGEYSKKLKRIYEEVDDHERCLLEQGFLCMGPATMGGCDAPCPKAGMPCDGCRGPTAGNSDQGLAMLDAMTSLTREANENFSLPQYMGTLYRYTYPSSRLAKVLNGGEKK